MSALFEATPAVSFVGRVVQREVGIVVGAARAHAPSIPVPPDCLISDRPRRGPGPAIHGSFASCNFVSSFHDLCVSVAGRFVFAAPFPNIVPGVQWVLYK